MTFEDRVLMTLPVGGSGLFEGTDTRDSVNGDLSEVRERRGANFQLLPEPMPTKAYMDTLQSSGN